MCVMRRLRMKTLKLTRGIFPLLVVAASLVWTSGALAAPANDNFANAQVITGPNGSANGSNIGATAEAGEPLIPTEYGPESGGSSIWYSWRATATGPITFTTEGSSFDTILGVFTGNSIASVSP